MSEAVLQATGITRAFGRVQAVHGLSLRVHAGEIYGLIGPDGAGKTTTIRILVGMLRPDAGTVQVLGQPASSESAALRSSVGYMPQQYSLYGDLTVHENLSFFADLFGLDKKSFQERSAKLLHLARLERFVSRRADALSGGMYKKLALACALLHRPRLLVLDEPTNGVDPVSRREFWELLQGLVLEGMAVLISTPYMDEAARCHRVGVIHKGKLLDEGQPEELLRATAAEVYLIAAKDRHQLAQQLEGHPLVIALSPAGGGLRVIVRPGAMHELRAMVEQAQASCHQVAAQFEDFFMSRMHEQEAG